jgi:hypothetical protein
MEFKHGFERQQDGEIVVDKKNAAFHMVVWGGRSCPPFFESHANQQNLNQQQNQRQRQRTRSVRSTQAMRHLV